MKAFNRLYSKRLAEQMAVAFVAGFGGEFLAGGGQFTKALFVAAGTAGLRAVYGLVTKPVGTDKAAPQVK